MKGSSAVDDFCESPCPQSSRWQLPTTSKIACCCALQGGFRWALQHLEAGVNLACLGASLAPSLCQAIFCQRLEDEVGLRGRLAQANVAAQELRGDLHQAAAEARAHLADKRLLQGACLTSCKHILIYLCASQCMLREAEGMIQHSAAKPGTPALMSCERAISPAIGNLVYHCDLWHLHHLPHACLRSNSRV